MAAVPRKVFLIAPFSPATDNLVPATLQLVAVDLRATESSKRLGHDI